ncbi:unnamed protein product, partial [Closterium sp. NIES-64]
MLQAPPVAAGKQYQGRLSNKINTDGGKCEFFGSPFDKSEFFDGGKVARFPPEIFDKGAACGACYFVSCVNNSRCVADAKVNVRVVGISKNNSRIIISDTAWSKIAKDKDKNPVDFKYERAPCSNATSIAVRVRDKSTEDEFKVQILGTAGPGSVERVEVSNDGSTWKAMERSDVKATWKIKGEKAFLRAKKTLSFRVTARDTKEQVVLKDVLPAADWKAATTYKSKDANFKKDPPATRAAATEPKKDEGKKADDKKKTEEAPKPKKDEVKPGAVRAAVTKAEEAVKKDDALARADEARKAAEAKKALRAANLRPKRLGASGEGKGLDSSIKRNTAVIRRLKQLSEDQRETILDEVRAVNMSKYVSEAVAAIAEAKLKMADIPAAVQTPLITSPILPLSPFPLLPLSPICSSARLPLSPSPPITLPPSPPHLTPLPNLVHPFRSARCCTSATQTSPQPSSPPCSASSCHPHPPPNQPPAPAPAVAAAAPSAAACFSMISTGALLVRAEQGGGISGAGVAGAGAAGGGGAVAGAGGAGTGASLSARISRKRSVFRLLVELFLCGVYGDASVIIGVVKEMASADGAGLVAAAAAAAAAGGGAGGGAEVGIGAGKSEREKERLEREREAVTMSVTLMLSFVRVGGPLLGFKSDPADEEVYTDLPVTAEQRKQLSKLVSSFFEALCTLVQSEQGVLRGMERDIARITAQRGEVGEDVTGAYEKSRRGLEQLLRNTNALAEALDRPPVVLPEDEHTTHVAGGGDSSAGSAGGAGADGGKREAEPLPLWDDDETRVFYEDLPDLKLFVPAVLLGDGGGKGGKGDGEEKESEEGEGKEEKEKDKEKGKEKGKEKDKEEKEKGKEKDKEKGKEKESEKEKEKVKGVEAAKLDDLLQRLPCVNSGASRHRLVDFCYVNSKASHHRLVCSLTCLLNASMYTSFPAASPLPPLFPHPPLHPPTPHFPSQVDFCYVNSKASRRRLVRALFAVHRTALQLLPYHARLAATLGQYMRDVGPALVHLLEEEFAALKSKKDQINIESKMRNIRFLGELAKFKVAPPSLIFSCLKSCLEDFSHHSIDVACALLETCGAFLSRHPDTKVSCAQLGCVIICFSGIGQGISRRPLNPSLFPPPCFPMFSVYPTHLSLLFLSNPPFALHFSCSSHPFTVPLVVPFEFSHPFPLPPRVCSQPAPPHPLLMPSLVSQFSLSFAAIPPMNSPSLLHALPPPPPPSPTPCLSTRSAQPLCCTSSSASLFSSLPSRPHHPHQVRMGNMLDIIQRLKNARSFDAHHSTLIDNAYFLCRPPDRVAKVVKTYPPLHQYIRKLLYADLSKSTVEKVLRQLRKLPWGECEGYVVRCLVKAHRARFNQIHLLASLVAALSRFRESVGVAVVDQTMEDILFGIEAPGSTHQHPTTLPLLLPVSPTSRPLLPPQLMEDIRLGLEVPDSSYQQRRITALRFLGELYSYRVVDSHLVFDTLHLLLFFGADTPETPLTVPSTSAWQQPFSPPATTFQTLSPSLIRPLLLRSSLVSFHPHSQSLPSQQHLMLDPPDDSFRIRMAATLLATCGHFFDRGSSRRRLDRFLLLFQAYMLAKPSVPLDVEFDLQAYMLAKPSVPLDVEFGLQVEREG